jgi:molybdopterin molybdotransferase
VTAVRAVTAVTAVTAVPLSVEAYLDSVLATVAPLGVETVALEAALGRVTASALCALQSVPLFDNSAMDGYAVRSEDVAFSSSEHPVWLRVVGTAIAGSGADVVVARGEAVRIMTGAPLPTGADRVIPVESSVAGSFDDAPLVGVWSAPKSHIRRAAEDIAAGAPLIEAGRTLGARDIGLLAATGHVAVLVRRRPRVAIVSTGDELHAGGTGSIPDSNSLYLAAAAQSVGAEISVRVVAPDDRMALEATLDCAARGSDLIVSSGGLGSGSHDLVRDAILWGSGAGDRGCWSSVTMKPGRPQAHGSWSGVPWIALPGNPTAALVSFESFVRPAIDRLSGRASSAPLGSYNVATGWSTPSGTTRFIPLAVAGCDGESSVSPGSEHGAHSLAAMLSAPLIGVLGAEVEGLHPGDLMTAFEPV